MILPLNWTATSFENILNYEQPSEYIVKSTNYNDTYEIPVLTAGKSFIIGYTNEKNGIYSQNLPVIIFDDFTSATQYVTFPFKVKSSAMKMLQPVSEKLNKKYIYYFMQTIKHNVTTHKRYWISDYSKRNIPLPPLAEQHRIVAKIDALFSRLDKGVETLLTIQQQLKTYRQAVLKWAFKGKLTKATLVEEKLGSFTDLITKGSSPRWQGFDYINDKNETLFITSENVQNGFIHLVKEKYLNSDFNRIQARSILRKNDVLFNIVGASIGRAAVFTLNAKANINQAVCLIRLNDNLDSKYLCYLLNSELLRQKYIKKIVDVARANISLTDVDNFLIPYCSIEEQSKIVTEIESRLSICDKLEAIVEENLNKAQALKQSILKKAFAGQLVPQDPNDEPAEKLLECIKTEQKFKVQKHRPAKKNR